MTSHPAPAPQAPSTQLDAHLAHFQWRVLQDALTEATAEHWEHRAAALEEARPRPGDHHGTATRTDLRHAYDRLTLAATNCRHHATLLRDTGLDTETQHAITQVLTDRHQPELVA